MSHSGMLCPTLEISSLSIEQKSFFSRLTLLLSSWDPPHNYQIAKGINLYFYKIAELSVPYIVPCMKPHRPEQNCYKSKKCLEGVSHISCKT